LQGPLTKGRVVGVLPGGGVKFADDLVEEPRRDDEGRAAVAAFLRVAHRYTAPLGKKAVWFTSEVTRLLPKCCRMPHAA